MRYRSFLGLQERCLKGVWLTVDVFGLLTKVGVERLLMSPAKTLTLSTLNEQAPIGTLVIIFVEET